MQWTDEQARAIAERGTNLLLSAAAGSGKTTVLVERVLRLILDDGADVDRMLIVTFTRAAASDMRAKLSKQLALLAASGNARCRDQMIRLERASITTLHAFCADFLRTHFEVAGVDPAFRILDDPVQRRLMDEALDEILEEAYASPSPDLLALDYGRGPQTVRDLTEALCAVLQERPDPDQWLEKAASCDRRLISAWMDELMRSARRAIGQARMNLVQAMNLPGCPVSYHAAMEKDLAAIADIEAIGEYDPMLRAIEGFKFASARKAKGDDEESVETVKRLRDAAKDALKGVKLLEHPAAQAVADIEALAPQLGVLGELARKTSARFEEKKAELSGLTYSDLERRTLIALRDDDTAREMRRRFDYVFVDEYQDTSDIQEAIVSRIRRENNVFMVGDVKQSIYRFRLAEPRLFIEKYDAYRAGDGGRLLPLTRNFRSKPAVLHFVNMVFERVMTGGDAEVEYDSLARLNPGLPDAEPGAPVEIHLLEQTGDVDEAIAELKAAERQGLFIARRIRSMMQADPSLHYRDFAILTRSKSSAFTPMMPMLLSENIPAYADGATGYFDTVEVALAISMLRLIANRRSDVELIALLRSPVAGLTAEELAQIRIHAPNVPYADAAKQYAAEKDDSIAARLKDFFAMLSTWKLRSGAVGLGELLRSALDESGFYIYAGALPGGAQRQANLDRLVSIAASFDADVSGSLTRFLGHTEKLKQKGDGDAAHILGENDDVVRMMTVHKSKGLEFRVVFGALLEKRYGGARAELLSAHRDLGLGLSLFDPQLRTKRKTIAQSAIAERRRREDAAEEMRILYVLLTRARERLILVGAVKGAEKALAKWDALSHAVSAAGSHLDLIMAARAAALREGADVWSTVEVHEAGELSGEAQAAPDPRALFDEIMADPEAFADEKLDEELSWSYPDELSTRKPLKLTVSGLLREVEGPEALPEMIDRPAFMQEESEKTLTGAERGTAYHRAIQLMDFAPLKKLEGRPLIDEIRIQLDAFAQRKLMSHVQREAVRPSMLAKFLSGDLGRRLLAATEVHREWPFNVMLRTEEALTAEETGRFAGEELLVQGTVDCCFMEDGAWVLLDYKTDRSRDVEALKAHYQKQLQVYALALERITGIPVRQKYLCLLASDVVAEI